MKDRRHIVETFSTKQLEKLLRKPDLRAFTGLRDYTLMLFLLETGVRVNELIGIDVQDVKFKDGVVRIRNTKNNFERVVPIQKKMKDTLEKYIAIRGIVECPALFVTIDGTPLSKKQLQHRITKYGKDTGLNGVRVSPHTFRHTFAKLSVQAGANIFELQQILGHSSMEMVRVYVNLFSDEVKNSHKNFSPLKELNVRL